VMKIKYTLTPLSLFAILALSACAGIEHHNTSQFLSIQDGRAVLVLSLIHI
jgi:hypothetical protein